MRNEVYVRRAFDLSYQRINESRALQRKRVVGDELRSLYEIFGEEGFGCIQIRPDHYACAVVDELLKEGLPAVRGFVKTVDEEARLLELLFYEEGRRNFRTASNHA